MRTIGFLILGFFVFFGGACGGIFVNRFPLNLPVSDSLASKVFSASSDDEHIVYLLVHKKTVGFNVASCLAGSLGRVFPLCTKGPSPIIVRWSVIDKTKNTIIISGRSDGLNLNQDTAFSYDDESVTRKISTFTTENGHQYEVEAVVENYSDVVHLTHPEIMLRIPALNSW